MSTNGSDIRDAVKMLGASIARAHAYIKILGIGVLFCMVIVGAGVAINGCNALRANDRANAAQEQSANAQGQTADTIACLRTTRSQTRSRDRCLRQIETQVTAPGKPGASGRRGATGATGPIGLKGDEGEKGDTGATGPRGPQGLPGTQGVQGAKGDKGDPGDAGTSPPPAPARPPTRPPDQRPDRPGDRPPPDEPPRRPPPGMQGPRGEKGDPGEKGEKGDTGQPGAPGTVVLSIETACPNGLGGGLTPGVATDPDGDGNFTCP